MAAPWVNQRRAQGPPALTPHPRPIISVEEWEAKSPLVELQTRSVNALKSVCEERRLPLKVRSPTLHCMCRCLYV